MLGILAALLLCMKYEVAIKSSLPGHEYLWTIATGLLGGVLASGVVAYAQNAYEGFNARSALDRLRTALFKRDQEGFVAETLSLARYLEIDSPYSLATGHPDAPSLVELSRAVVNSFRFLEDRTWSRMRAELESVNRHANAIRASDILTLSDRQHLLLMFEANASAAAHYSSPQPSAEDAYNLVESAAELFVAVNESGGSADRAFVSLRELCKESRLASPTWATDPATRVRACLVDLLLVAGIGLLLKRERIGITNRNTLSMLGIDGNVAGTRVSGQLLCERLLKCELGFARLDEFLIELRQRWLVDPHTVMPTFLLRNNLCLLSAAGPSQFLQLVRELESSAAYFADEVAVLRLNICFAILRERRVERFGDLFDECLDGLSGMEGRLYGEGILQVRAIGRWMKGEVEGALDNLTALVKVSSVLPVRLSAIRAALKMAASLRDGARFIQLRDQLHSEEEASAMQPLTILSASLLPIESAAWYFVSLPPGKRYIPCWLDITRQVV